MCCWLHKDQIGLLKRGNFNAKKERQMKLPGAQVPVLSLKQFPTPDPLHA
jgi:hypothetical protein